MAKTCLFIINGLGLGNSTRCYAVIEHLLEHGFEIHVLTSGNGLIFFGNKEGIASLTPMEAFFYTGIHGRISGWRILASLGSLYARARRKRAQLENLLHEIQADVVVTDSEYALAPVRRRRIPIIALNNADVVVGEYLGGQDRPRSIRSHFWAVEFSDYLFHRRVADLVISPAAAPLKPRHARIRRVGLIIRRALRDALRRTEADPFPPPRQIRSVVFMLSGSIFASEIPFGDGAIPFHIDVVGRSGPSRANVTYHGKLMNNVPLLMKADALVINAGFSAVSEAIALNKPTFVIPVPGHAEQFINARVLRDLGYGYIVTQETVMPMLLKLYERNEWEGLKPRGAITGIDGAREAAAIIEDFVGPSSTPPQRRG